MGCDDTYYDVSVLLPVKLRFWAENEQAAIEQWKDCELVIQGSQMSFSIGFPEGLSVELVASAEPISD